MQSEQVALEQIFRGTQAGETRTIAEQLRSLGETTLKREQNLVWRHLAIDQSEILVESLNILTQESDLDKFLVHALKVVKQQRQVVAGTLGHPGLLHKRNTFAPELCRFAHCGGGRFPSTCASARRPDWRPAGVDIADWSHGNLGTRGRCVLHAGRESRVTSGYRASLSEDQLPLGEFA